MSPLKIRFVQIQKYTDTNRYIPTTEISRLKQNFFGSDNYYVASSNKSELWWGQKMNKVWLLSRLEPWCSKNLIN